jgi:hypothetical protein
LVLLILVVLWLTGNLGGGRLLGPRVQVDQVVGGERA